MKTGIEIIGLGLFVGFLAFFAFSQKRETSHTISTNVSEVLPILLPGEYIDSTGRRCFGNICLAIQKGNI